LHPFWATVCKTVRPMLSVRCLSCLSACLSFCDARALRPNGWTDQDETWHAGRPRTWPHCVRWEPISPSQRGTVPPIFGPYLLRPNDCIDQDVTWYGTRPRPRRLCVRWGPRFPLPVKGAEPPNFRPMFIVAKRLDGTRWSKMSLGRKMGLGPGDFVLDGDPASPSPQRGWSPSPIFGHVYCVQTAGWIKMALDKEVGLSPVHIVLDGGHSSLPQKGGRAPQTFGPTLLWPNGMDA